jgi:hypothetical protein
MKVIVNLALFSEGRTCFVKYADMPDHQKGWFVPHMQIQLGDDPLVACDKILREQLGIRLNVQPLVKDIQSFTGNDGSWHFSFDYRADLPEAFLTNVTAATATSVKVQELKWFPLGELPAPAEVAHHGWGIDIVNKLSTASA